MARHGSNELTVTVDTAELIGILEKNRDGHAAQVEKARAGWLQEAKAELEKALDRVRAGDTQNLYIGLGGVADETKSYNQTIAMLKMHQSPTIEIEAQDFRAYVLDDWGWKDAWITSNSKYLGAGTH